MQPGYLVFLNMAVSIITFFIHMLTVFVQIDFSLKHQNEISKKILYILSVEIGIMWSSEHTSFLKYNFDLRLRSSLFLASYDSNLRAKQLKR